MAGTVAQMTRKELVHLIEISVEQKLLEMLVDPDEGLKIRGDVRDRLLRQRRAVASGERGQSLDQVVQRLGLE